MFDNDAIEGAMKFFRMKLEQNIVGHVRINRFIILNSRAVLL